MRIRWRHWYKLLPLFVLMMAIRCQAATNTTAKEEPGEDFFYPGRAAARWSNTPPRLEIASAHPRAPVGEPTTIQTVATGNLTGFYRDYELWVNDEKYTQPGWGSVNTSGYIDWIPTNTGSYSLVAKLHANDGRILTSAPVRIEVLRLKHPPLTWLDGPPTHLLTTEKFHFRVAATNTDGELADLIVSSAMDTTVFKDSFQFSSLRFDTNKAILDVQHEPLPIGTYHFHVRAIDSDLMETNSDFTCQVDCPERTDMDAPSGLTVHVLHADAYLHWTPPADTPQIVGTLVQRKEVGSNFWDYVGFTRSPAVEWRDGVLPPVTYCNYRISFLLKGGPRTPFSIESDPISRQY